LANDETSEKKVIYIYISPIYIRVFLWRIKFTIWQPERKNGCPKGFVFERKKKGLKSPYLEGGKKGVELAIFRT
jgi:hypothetical protein